MLHGGIAERIVTFANRLVGHVRSGLGMSNVLGCTLFGGVAGSPLADVSAMGSVMIPLMKRGAMTRTTRSTSPRTRPSSAR